MNNLNDEYINISKRLTDIEIHQGIILEKLDSMHKEKNQFHDDIKEILKKHNYTIYGNGNPGLVDLRSIPKALKDHATSDMWAFGIIIGLLVTELGWSVFHGR